MSRIILFGMSPLPFENDKKAYGTGIRTWQFILPLLENGHDVCLISYAIPSAFPDGFSSILNKKVTYKNYSFLNHLLVLSDFENTKLLSELTKEFCPDIVAGITLYPGFIASEVIGILKEKIKLPFWADLFGHAMAEGQARAYMDNSDSCLFHYWNREYNILKSADIFSCVSGRQAFATIGELGSAGRLNKATSGYEFTNVIPIGIPDEEYAYKKTVFREKGSIKKDDFVILWTGGFNTWTDIDTLFEGLEAAMKINPKIKFVATGGEIPEQDIITYPRFVSLVNSSLYRNNFLLEGWINGKDVPNYYYEADLGINIDKDIYEVKLGSKSRILDWMRAGLPVISSNVCELTEIIKNKKIGYTFKPHDAAGLARKLLELSEKKEELEKTGQKAKEYAKKNFSFLETVKPFIRWVAEPYFAPDKNLKKQIFFEKEEALKNCEKIIKNQARMIQEKDARIVELVSITGNSPIKKIYGYLKILKRKIKKEKTDGTQDTNNNSNL